MFCWDGIFTGAATERSLRPAMIGSLDYLFIDATTTTTTTAALAFDDDFVAANQQREHLHTAPTHDHRLRQSMRSVKSSVPQPVLDRK